MAHAALLTGYGSPEVLVWTEVPLPQPGPGQIRIRVRAAGVGPTDLKIRRGDLQAVFPLPSPAVLGFEASGVVDALGRGVSGVAVGDAVAADLPALSGYGEYALATTWTSKPDGVSWVDAAALPASAEAAVGVLRQLEIDGAETLLILGGGGAVGLIATQLAVARGVTVVSAVGEHDTRLVSELGAEPVRYGPGLGDRLRGRSIHAVFDAAGQGLSEAVLLAGGPERVITIADGAGAAAVGARLSGPSPERAPQALAHTLPLLASGKLRLRASRTVPLREAARAHHLLEAGGVHEKLVLTAE